MSKTVAFDATHWYEWVYPRAKGDITVFAPTRELAADEIRKHGFKCDPAKLVLHDRTLTDVLHREGIS